MREENYKEFVKRVKSDKSAFNLIMCEYFKSHPEYNEMTDKIEEVM